MKRLTDGLLRLNPAADDNPKLADFHQSLIYIVNHDENGAIGVNLNTFFSNHSFRFTRKPFRYTRNAIGSSPDSKHPMRRSCLRKYGLDITPRKQELSKIVLQ